jgi:hypothetical protein
VLVAEGAVPDGAVNNEQADGVIVVGLLQIPAVAGVVGGDPQQVAFEQFVIDGIAVVS